jgi:UDP-2,3-diacylglucosamine pyrophosphatase LpxH
VLAIPDLHFPWHHQDTLTWIYQLIADRKPDDIVQLGDLYDMYSSSRFAKTHDLMTPKQELAEGRLGAATMWKNIKTRAPKAKCWQIRGNHDVRPEKRVQELVPEVESLLEMKPIFEFPGVTTLMDPTEELEIDGVIYTHGTFTQANGAHCKHYMQPVVHGHTHRGSVFFMRKKGGLIWELDCGFASDETQVPLRFTATRRTGWTLGCGWIDSTGPSFIPFPWTPKKALPK